MSVVGEIKAASADERIQPVLAAAQVLLVEARALASQADELLGKYRALGAEAERIEKSLAAITAALVR